MKSKNAKQIVSVASVIKDRKYHNPSTNAMNLNYYVNVLTNQEEYRKAKILECRLKKEFRNLPKSEIKEEYYDYYIHFIFTNRRMDHWTDTTRMQKLDEFIDDDGGNNSSDEDAVPGEGMDDADRAIHEAATRIKTVSKLYIGEYWAEAWYYSAFPDGYHESGEVHFCEFCLSFFSNNNLLKIHSDRCNLVHPPGNMIYTSIFHEGTPKEKEIAMWEVDAFKNTPYAENLSFLAKLFLDHKTLVNCIRGFLFYVLTEKDEAGHKICGYFSKYKDNSFGNNLSCILMLPFHQRKGYGKFIINFSYALSKKEKIVGTPETPL